MRRLCPRQFGSLVQANAKRLLPILSLALIAACAALNSAKLDAELASWIQRTARVERELQTVGAALGPGAGTSGLLLLQAPLEEPPLDDGGDSAAATATAAASEDGGEAGEGQQRAEILSVRSLMVHLEALAIASHVTVELYDVSWSLRDLCLSLTPPDYDDMLPNQMLEQLMPCAIKTPLDCFWEGAKLLGPDHDVRLSSIGPKLKWTNLNPRLMVEAMRRDHPHASFPFETLIDWMDRVGIGAGYQQKPCLDPTDPGCPESAPNKVSGLAPDVASQLTGGCHGLAGKQMHWLEEELIGGVRRNKSGFVASAEALQSTIQLMGEQDIYDYWRKTNKVQDINNWSADKAKLILEAWQRRFREELDQFSRTSKETRAYRIYAMTPKSMLEPMGIDSITNANNFKLTIALMTMFTLLSFPNFIRSDDSEKNCSTGRSSKTKTFKKLNLDGFRRITMAILTSLLVGLTFVASLGLSSFMNLPLNMATTQILPPLALYYGFKQALMVADIYSRNYNRVPMEELTTECLNELLPLIFIEFTMFVVPLSIATILPVTATRIFAYQAIAYFIVATFTSIFLIPSLMTYVLFTSIETRENRSSTSHSTSTANKLSIRANKQSGQDGQRNGDDTSSLEEHIFSRLPYDLKNIKADSRQPTDISFTAYLGPNGFTTNLRLNSACEFNGRSTCKNDLIDKSCASHQQPTMVPPISSFVDNKGLQSTTGLPDLVLWPTKSYDENPEESNPTIGSKPESINKSELEQPVEDKVENRDYFTKFLVIYTDLLANNRPVQSILLLARIAILIVILSWAGNVRYGLQMKDIIVQGTADYDSSLLREKYFPIYNVFAITKGNLDYPNNQRLLYEFHKRIEQVEGVVRDNQMRRPKFWLAYFRDWLIEIQDKFDSDRNKSAISNEGWTQGASEAARLAYKLLAQTGRIDNPIDKSLVETNRLVDKNGIINHKAFYYYLTAWTKYDAFSYANCEANFKPEPKNWDDKPDDLRIERAKPLTFTQIPFLLKLPGSSDNFKAITELRSISHAFEQLNLPNFPNGIPFIFWDQFINLDLMFFSASIVIIAALYLIVGITVSNFTMSAIILLPTTVTLFEIYGLLGLLSIPFNNIVATMIICNIGATAVQTLPLATHIAISDDESDKKLGAAFRERMRLILTSLMLLFICAIVFRSAYIDFMTQYASILLCLAAINTINSLLFAPILLRFLCSTLEQIPEVETTHCTKVAQNSRVQVKTKHRFVKKKAKRRCYPRVQSEISLSTISEEPQSEARPQDLKFDISIKYKS